MAPGAGTLRRIGDCEAPGIVAAAVYAGHRYAREIDDPVFQGVDWLSIRPKIKNAPRIIRPGPVDR
mgnify:CR=1 FL=1